MKIALLGYAGSIHLMKLANSLASREIETVVITQHKPLPDYDTRIKIIRLPFSGRLGYTLNAPSLRRILAKEQPDILHTHFASGYGTLGRISRYLPNILSVWGSDIYIFPYKGKFARRILEKNLAKATAIFSTSADMADATEAISRRKVIVTHFGIDTKKFTGRNVAPGPVLGTVRALQPIYGIDILIRAFGIFLQSPAGQDAKLIIVGDGPQEKELRELTEQMKIADRVDFRGRVEHGKIPEILSEMKVFAVLSRSESYCVAALEAQACGVPVVASAVGGLPEVVRDGITGILVPTEDPSAAAAAFERLFTDTSLSAAMSKAAVEFVRADFEEEKCVDMIVNEYKNILGKV